MFLALFVCFLPIFDGNFKVNIIELVEKDLKEPLSKPKTKDEWDSYFAYAFKRDFKNFTQDVITNIAQKLKE